MKCRKLLAILLALVMVIGLLPFAALAEEVPGSSPGDEVSDKIVADQNDPLPEGDPLGEQPPEVSLLNNEHHAGATALKSTDSELFDGSYYLSEDVKLNKPVKFSGTATLCLNGHKLSCGSDKVITVDGTLTICDCADGGKIEATDRANFAINVERNGTLNVEGGTICGGYRGISGSLNSEINISGGTIQKSGSSTYKALELNGTTATITDGTITGGVELKSSSKLSLGGTPTVDTIKLTHTSCSINATADSEPYSGGSITIDYGDLDYSDGAAIVSGVTEENAESFIVTPPKGMVVKLDENGNLILKTPTTAPGHKNHGANGTGTITETWKAWDPTETFNLEHGYYYLDQSYEDLKNAITVTGDVHLCLNGHEMSDNGRNAEFITVNSGASLTICDCSKGKTGTINYKCTTGYAILNNGALTLYSGKIYSEVGNGIDIINKGGSNVKFDMEGGTIDVGGTGILFSSGDKVNINGGTLTYGGKTGVLFGAKGTLTVSDGIICPRDDGGDEESRGISRTSAGDLCVTGGNISGKQYGIRVIGGKSGAVTISGGNISASGEKGYGIYLYETATANLYLSKDPKISGEKADLHISNPNRVYAKANTNNIAYYGSLLDIYYAGVAETADPIILDVNDDNDGKFTLVYPKDKTLVRQGNNLVLGTEDVSHREHNADGTGNIPAGNKWDVWDGTTQMDTAGYYYLDENVTLTSTISVTKDVHLCLNGHKITVPDGSKVSAMFKIENSGKLSVCDCQEGGRIEMLRDGSNNMAIQVMSRRTFDLYSGTIYAAGSSRAVYSNSGTVNVSGGIIESPSTINGALRADGKDAVVNLSGGEIKGAVTLRSGPKVYLSGSPELTTIDIKAINESYPIEIHAASKDGTSYTGDAIEISTVETNLQPGHIVVYNVNENNYKLFTLKDNKIVREDDNLVIASDGTIELTVTPPDFTYGDPDAVIKVTTLPEDATLSFSLDRDSPTTLGTIDKNTGELTDFDAGTFTVTVTATKEGYTAASETVEFTVKKKDVTITAKNQTIDYEDGDIIQGANQVTASGLVNEDVLSEITLTADKSAKTITASNAVIKNGDRNVNKNYDVTYASGTLTLYNVPQEGFAITGKPATVTYGDTFKLTATGGSGEGAVTWTAEGAAKVDQEGNVTITGAGDFTIKATKAGDDTFAAATATYQGTAQKRALTITAADETIAFNAAAPSYTATVAGAVQADKEAIADAYDLTSTYVKGNPVGNYPITVTVNLSDDLQAKYIVTANNGTLHVVETMAEVVQAPTAVENLVYTGKAQKLVTAGEAKNGTMVYSLNGTTYQEAVPTRINAGTYTVWYKVVGNNGYSDTAAKSFTVTIKKAPLTVTADDIWVYAGNTPKFTATIKGYVNGEDWRVLKGELTFTCGYSEKYSKPGSRHIITPEGLRADNYDITFETGILTVKDPLSPRFNVYVLDSKHGTVEADCRYARKGDVVTLTIKPDWGYELETLTVTDSHGYELKLTYHSNGTYTFTMPRDNVTVKAIFTVRDMPFVDVPGDAWYAGGVRYVYAHGLMNGTGSWRFSPNRTTTRAMIATILYRMEGSPRVYGTSRFGDVEAGSWYEDAVIWATQNDIVEGYTSKTFGPNDPITREQMAAMLYRYADYCRCDMSAGRYVDLSKFSDMNEISDYAIPALRWAVGEEIIQGRTGKRLAPTDTATRAEVAVMLMRFCEEVIW